MACIFSLDSVGTKSEINIVKEDSTIIGFHTSALTDGVWNWPWSPLGPYYQLVAIFHFYTKYTFPLITSTWIIKLYKQDPRCKVALLRCCILIEAGKFMYVLLTASSVQFKQTRTDELVNKTENTTSISQDIHRINILNSIIEAQILSLHNRTPEEAS